jgi:hypothetical protein
MSIGMIDICRWPTQTIAARNRPAARFLPSTGRGAATIVDRRQTTHQIQNVAAPPYGGMSLHVYSKLIDPAVLFDEGNPCGRGGEWNIKALRDRFCEWLRSASRSPMRWLKGDFSILPPCEAGCNIFLAR